MCAFTVEMPLPFSVAVVRILWPFVLPFWRHSATFLSRLLKYSCTNTDAVQHCTCVEPHCWYIAQELR